MHKTGTAAGYKDLLNQLNTFLTATGSAFGLTYEGAGSGRLTEYRGGANSIAEVFTLTARSAASFDVAGSTSGSLGTATVGVPFETDVLAFTLTAGAVPFQAGDTFQLATAPKWQALRAVTDSEYIWKAPGNNGEQAIYTGMLAYSDGSTHWNLRCNGYTSYNPALDFYAQAGGIQYDYPLAFGHPGLGLWTGSIPYWFIADGRRVIVIAKVSTVYEAAYLGTADTFIDPTSYPSPLVVGGSIVRQLSYASTDATNHSCFVMPGNTSWSHTAHLLLRMPSGGWNRFTTNYEYTDYGVVHPFYVGSQWVNGMNNLTANLDGSLPAYPITLATYGPRDVVAQLAGIYAVPGATLTAEQRLTLGPIDHLVVNNTWRTGNGDYYTVALD